MLIPKQTADEIFAAVPATFVSPFPAYGGQLGGWLAGVREAFGAESAAAITGAQGQAWAIATQMAYQAKALGALDMLREQLDIAADVRPDGVVTGIFGDVQFGEAARQLRNGNVGPALAEIGFEVATNLLGAIPIFGNALKGLANVARLAVEVFRATKERQELLVPWIDGDQTQTDETIVEHVLRRQAMPGVDWTPLFRPALSPRYPFRLRQADSEKGPYARSWAPYAQDGVNPAWSDGIGYMPGGSRVLSVMQYRSAQNVAEFAHIQNVGDYIPASTQVIGALWSLVNAPGPDMYKVDTGAVSREWDDLQGQMWSDVWREIERLGGSEAGADHWEQVRLFRMLGPYIVHKRPDGSWGGTTFARIVQPQLTPEVLSGRPARLWRNQPKEGRYGTAWEQLGRPAVEALRKRQRAKLGRSLSCAYVRPVETREGPAYAAFRDDALRERCESMRRRLLASDARFLIDLDDVRPIDSGFADALQEAGVPERRIVGGVRVSAGSVRPVLDAATPVGPPAPAPGGGQPLEPTGGDEGGSDGLIVGGILAGIAGVGAYALSR